MPRRSASSKADDPVPRRPWGIESQDKFLRVCSIEDDGTFGEVIFYMNYDDQRAKHQPTEMARAQFIVDAVNSYKRLKRPRSSRRRKRRN